MKSLPVENPISHPLDGDTLLKERAGKREVAKAKKALSKIPKTPRRRPGGFLLAGAIFLGTGAWFLLNPQIRTTGLILVALGAIMLLIFIFPQLLPSIMKEMKEVRAATNP